MYIINCNGDLVPYQTHFHDQTIQNIKIVISLKVTGQHNLNILTKYQVNISE